MKKIIIISLFFLIIAALTSCVQLLITTTWQTSKTIESMPTISIPETSETITVPPTINYPTNEFPFDPEIGPSDEQLQEIVAWLESMWDTYRQIINLTIKHDIDNYILLEAGEHSLVDVYHFRVTDPLFQLRQDIIDFFSMYFTPRQADALLIGLFTLWTPPGYHAPYRDINGYLHMRTDWNSFGTLIRNLDFTQLVVFDVRISGFFDTLALDLAFINSDHIPWTGEVIYPWITPPYCTDCFPGGTLWWMVTLVYDDGGWLIDNTGDWANIGPEYW